ncbi:uncharacterized protein LOC119769618 [Culex quinquefasciatus]|uniref:uncharacterized protein LOC119769618 n=1 Tax=Culex quinquefasciatus TaxID=7176 RepID=UPI0018E3E7BA|nr:uncharacterized protein LOC119769618 [Culex quinquefasciatus]
MKFVCVLSQVLTLTQAILKEDYLYNRKLNFNVQTIVSILNEYYVNNHLPTQISYSVSDAKLVYKQNDLINSVLKYASENSNILFHLAHFKQRTTFFYNLIFIDDLCAFRSVLLLLNSGIYNFSGLYTVVITGLFDEALIQEILAKLWSIKITNAIILTISHSDVHETIAMYTYFPFEKNNCGQVNPVLLTNLKSHNDFNKNDILFPNKWENLHNCTLKAGTFEIKPFIIMDYSNGDFERNIDGFEAKLIEIVQRKLNFQIQYHFPAIGTQWGFIGENNSTGLMKMIQSGQVDFGIASIALTADRSEFLQAGSAHYTSKIVFAIPDGRLYTPLEKLFRPFKTSMWYAVVFCLTSVACSVVAFYRLGSHRLLNLNESRSPVMNIFSVFFGGPSSQVPEQNCARMVLFSWIYYCFIIRTVYQSLLFQYLQQEQRWPEVETIEDIEREGLTYYMADIAQRFFINAPHVLERTQILPHESDYLSKALERLARNEIYGVVCVILNNIAYHNKFKAHIGVIHAMTNPILTYSIAMHYPKNSPLAEHFDKIINKLQPSGIADYWANNYGNNAFLHQIKQTYNVPKPLTNAQLIGLYKVSTLLLSIAIIVFLCELFTFWISSMH